jgi:hypothetical protein
MLKLQLWHAENLTYHDVLIFHCVLSVCFYFVHMHLYSFKPPSKLARKRMSTSAECCHFDDNNNHDKDGIKSHIPRNSPVN